MSFEFTPQKLVYGGDALGHHQGRTILVPRALPGERVEAEEVRTAKGVTHARPLRIITAAPERVAPPCPYFGTCGGCQYQHLNYENQSVWKREILRETLRRIGKITWDADIGVSASAPWNYRNQAQIKVARSGEGVELGFYQAESHRLVSVTECLILSPRLNAALGVLRNESFSESLASCTEIEMMADDRDEHMMITLRGSFGAQPAAALARECQARLPGAVCVAVERPSGVLIRGEPALQYTVGEFCYRISPGSFFQASRHLLPRLVDTVTGGQSGSLALDLYAGVGLFTLPLARKFEHVVGVESNAPAAADLKTNALANGLGRVRVAGEGAYDFLRRFAQVHPDLVVLDPPRAEVGAPTVEFLTKIAPVRLHYVSCHPPTLARDLGMLTARGYQLNTIEMFDFFPHTSHIECVAKLTRCDRAGS